jgi:hypothetical protein
MAKHLHQKTQPTETANAIKNSSPQPLALTLVSGNNGGAKTGSGVRYQVKLLNRYKQNCPKQVART